MARARSALLIALALLVPLACSEDDDGSDAASASGSEAEASTTTTERETTTTSSAPTTSTSAGGGAPTSTTTPAGPGIRLTGEKGSGTFAYEVYAERSELCYRMEVDGIGTGTAARIVRAAEGSSVVNLIAPESGDSINTCVASDAVTLQEIEAEPAGFAVEVVGSGGRLTAKLT